MATESEKLVATIANLTASTASGGIDWIKANPTTYSWINSAGRVTLQRISPSARLVAVTSSPSISYHLEVADSSGAPQLSISSKKSTEVAQALQSLYEGIVSTMTLKGVDLLNEMVNSAK